MFSFFKSKKPSPGEPIPGPIPSGPTPREDEFIFVERRDKSSRGGDSGASVTSPTASSGLYPEVPGPLDAATADAGCKGPAVRQRSEEKLSHALHGVPFRLSADLDQAMNSEITRLQVNEILTYVGRAMYAPGYDFSLERSVLNE